MGADVVDREVETPLVVGILGDGHEPLVLRPVTPADEPFLRDLYASSRAGELAVVPWSDEERRAFCDSQFALQDDYYRRVHLDARFDVIEQGGVAVGRLLVATRTDEIELLDIALVPGARGGGLGTGLVRWLQHRVAVAGVPLVLSVDPGNPAERLYERLGFRLRAEGELHRVLVWAAEAVGAGALERFLLLAVADAGLRALLAGADDDDSLAARTVEAGLALGLVFTPEDVVGALRARRRAWIERSVR